MMWKGSKNLGGETMELEQRVSALEGLVQAIINLPHLSNAGGIEIQQNITNLKSIINRNKERLSSEKLIPPTRRELEEDIAKFEYLISPAICAEFYQRSSSKKNFPTPEPLSESERKEFEKLCAPLVKYIHMNAAK